MSWVAAGVVGGSIIGGVLSGNAQQGAADTAANAQTQASQAGIAEQQRQFDAIQKLLSPYVNAGTGALTAQQNLIGINGSGAQQSAIDALKASPAFTSQQQLGENRILQNASATGGLRGGNVQGALAQFSPALLAQTINDQYSRLGGMTSLGQNAAAGVGNAGMQTGSSIAGLLQQGGAAQAGAALAGGQAQANLWNSVGSGIGTLAGRFGGATGTQVGGATGAYGSPVAAGSTAGSSFGSLGSGFYGMGGF